MALGKYLYGIIRSAEERVFEGLNAIGDPNAPVHSVAWGGLTAVVSDCTTVRLEATRQNLLAHEKVLEALMREQTPLPVRFGTVADSDSAEANIRQLLKQRATEFDGLLHEMEGEAELSLKAFWRSDSLVFDAIVAKDDRVRSLRDALRRHPGGGSQASRMRLGEMVKVALERMRAAEAKKILGPLSHAADRVADNPVLLDRMILNSAFLVRRDREAEFDRIVAELEAERAEQVRFMYVGPVAPYDFVRIIVNWDDVRAA